MLKQQKMKKIKNLTKRIFNAKRVGTLAMLHCNVNADGTDNGNDTGYGITKLHNVWNILCNFFRNCCQCICIFLVAAAQALPLFFGV